MRSCDTARCVAIVLCVAASLPPTLLAETTPTETAPAAAPAHDAVGTSYMTQWLVLGPFPNPKLDEVLPDGVRYGGYHKDYLVSLGGEAHTLITPNTTVTYRGAQGKQHTVRAHPSAPSKDFVDFQEVYGEIDFVVAYAFSYVRSDKDQDALVYFGAGEGAKVYVNGELVHATFRRRPTQSRDDRFTIKLRKGLNTVLVKVLEGSESWRFIMELLDADARTTELAQLVHLEAMKKYVELGHQQVEPKRAWGYMITPGEFPKIDWEYPEKVKALVGEVTLSVRWFDAQGNKVTEAKAPGRYGFVAEGKTSDGVTVRRGGTIYCRHPRWEPWTLSPKGRLSYLGGPIDKLAWEQRAEQFGRSVGQQFVTFLETDPAGAAMAAYLSEITPTDGPLSPIDRWDVADADYHLKIKRKLMGVEGKYPAFKPPRKIEGAPAPILREGTEAEAGFKPGTAAKLRKICSEWYEHSKEPFVTLVARHGVIVFHEAFGENDAGPVALDTPMRVASITKTLTGMMFAQFMDQGLIAPEDPVGKFIPGFTTTGDAVLRYRNCFDHTTGFPPPDQYGGMRDPYLESVLANASLSIRPGLKRKYSSGGYNLAAKTMELVSGKSFFRLTYENFFAPLGARRTYMRGTDGGTDSTAMDLGRIAQMLLNRGAYGDLRFFSAKTFERLLPRPYEELYPKMKIKMEWGIGMYYEPVIKQDGSGEKILSERLLGHGAGSKAVLRADLDHDMIITQSRNLRGKDYFKYLATFFQALEDGLAD